MGLSKEDDNLITPFPGFQAFLYFSACCAGREMGVRGPLCPAFNRFFQKVVLAFALLRLPKEVDTTPKTPEAEWLKKLNFDNKTPK